jgi:hypothetical protein
MSKDDPGSQGGRALKMTRATGALEPAGEQWRAASTVWGEVQHGGKAFEKILAAGWRMGWV